MYFEEQISYVIVDLFHAYKLLHLQYIYKNMIDLFGKYCVYKLLFKKKLNKKIRIISNT